MIFFSPASGVEDGSAEVSGEAEGLTAGTAVSEGTGVSAGAGVSVAAGTSVSDAAGAVVSGAVVCASAGSAEAVCISAGAFVTSSASLALPPTAQSGNSMASASAAVFCHFFISLIRPPSKLIQIVFRLFIFNISSHLPANIFVKYRIIFVIYHPFSRFNKYITVFPCTCAKKGL